MVTIALNSSKPPAEEKPHCPQEDNKNAYQANILCSQTIEYFKNISSVFQNDTFSYKTCATKIAELS